MSAYLRNLRWIGTLAKRLGFADLAKRIREALDVVLRRRGIYPVASRVGDAVLRGFLRHGAALNSLSDPDYEAFTRRLFIDALTDDAVVVDIGAHIGLFTHVAAANTASADLFAVEPDGWNHAALLENLRRNGLSERVQVHHKAISDREGAVVFYVSVNTVSNSLINKPGLYDDKVEEVVVETVSVDRILEGTPLEGRRLVLKIDVEGAELRAFAGMRASVARAGSVVVLAETNPPALEAAGTSTVEEVAALRAMGLEVFEVDESAGRLVDPGDGARLGKGMILARRLD